MSHVALHIALLSAAAGAFYAWLTPAYSYFYAALTLAAIFLAIKSRSYNHIAVCLILMTVYMLENNQEIWLFRNDALRIIYMAATFGVLLFMSDHGPRLAETIAGLMACKLALAFAYPVLIESGAVYQSGLNFFAICYWVVYIDMTREQMAVNERKRSKRKGGAPLLAKLLGPIAARL